MNFEKWNEKHQNQTEKDIDNYLRIFDELLKMIVLYTSLETLKKDLFSFEAYSVLNKKINNLFERFHQKSVSKIDFFVNKHYRLSQEKFTGILAQYKSNPTFVRDAFRKDRKRILSDRVWQINAQFRQEIEMALDVAIADGVPASQLATHLKQYLKNPDALFRKYRDKNGVLQLSKNALAYHPGKGVYRSAYKNAERLARTEINIAYRTADIERWQGLDFIAGYEIKRSRNLSACSICDMMAGVYPKSFVWVGNHPNCRCYMVPIFKSDTRNKPLKINQKLTQWLSKNADNIPKNKPMFLWGVETPTNNPKLSRYKDIPFKTLYEGQNGGKIEIFTKGKQRKHEFKKNLDTIAILSGKGYQYRMLPVLEDGNKNPDAFNLITQKFADIKVAESTNGKNIIQSAIKEAKAQGVKELIIQLKNKPDSYRNMLGNALYSIKENRTGGIEEIIVIFPNKTIKSYSIERLKKLVRF